MKIYIIIFILILTGCVSTNTKGPISSKRIGVFYSLDQEMSICHRHTGITAFHNFENRYPIKEDISKLVTEGYVKGIDSTDNIGVEISEGPDFSVLMTFSFWNAIPTLTSKGIITVKEMGEVHNVDYLMVPWGFKKDLDNSICLGPSVRTGKSTSSPFIPVYIALVFVLKAVKLSRAGIQASVLPRGWSNLSIYSPPF